MYVASGGVRPHQPRFLQASAQKHLPGRIFSKRVFIARKPERMTNTVTLASCLRPSPHPRPSSVRWPRFRHITPSHILAGHERDQIWHRWLARRHRRRFHLRKRAQGRLRHRALHRPRRKAFERRAGRLRQPLRRRALRARGRGNHRHDRHAGLARSRAVPLSRHFPAGAPAPGAPAAS